MDGDDLYTKEMRIELLKEIANPANKMRGMSESTGLAILDGIYVLLQTLREIANSPQ